ETRHSRYRGRFVLRELKQKDVGNDLVPTTDEFRNIVSLRGLRFNAGKEFDPAGFVIWQYLPLVNSPIGTRDLDAAYGRYWLLDTVLKLRGMAAEKRYGPVV